MKINKSLLLILIMFIIFVISCSKNSSNPNPVAPGNTSTTRTLNVQVNYGGLFTFSPNYPIRVGAFSSPNNITLASYLSVQNATFNGQTLTFSVPSSPVYVAGFIDILNAGSATQPSSGEPFIAYNGRTNALAADSISIASGGTANVTITLGDSYFFPGANNLFVFELDGVKQDYSTSVVASPGTGVVTINAGAGIIFLSGAFTSTGLYTSYSTVYYSNRIYTPTTGQFNLNLIKNDNINGGRIIGIFNMHVTNANNHIGHDIKNGMLYINE